MSTRRCKGIVHPLQKYVRERCDKFPMRNPMATFNHTAGEGVLTSRDHRGGNQLTNLGLQEDFENSKFPILHLACEMWENCKPNQYTEGNKKFFLPLDKHVMERCTTKYGFLKRIRSSEAHQLFDELLRLHPLEKHVMERCTTKYGSLKRIRPSEAHQLFDELLRLHPLEKHVLEICTTQYGSLKRIHPSEAHQLFDELLQFKDTKIIPSTLIATFNILLYVILMSSPKDPKVVLTLYNRMMMMFSGRIYPTYLTYRILINSCFQIPDMKPIPGYFGVMLKRGLTCFPQHSGASRPPLG